MIDDKTLILYWYEDGLDEAERRSVERALREDRLLAARFEALAVELRALRPTGDEATAPEHLRHQWHDLVAREARLERQRSSKGRSGAPFSWLGLGAAFAAVLSLGVAIGLYLRDAPPAAAPSMVDANDSPSPGASTAAPAADAFARGVQVYLAESRGRLDGLDQRPRDEQIALLLRIVAQNRLFEEAAEQQDAPEIARLMRALEPVLLRLATNGAQGEDTEALRRQLQFELGAVLTKLDAVPSKEPNTI